MNLLRTITAIMLIGTVFELGAHEASAQIGSSATTTSGGVSPGGQATTSRASSSVDRASSGLPPAAIDPLQQADRAHADSTKTLLAKYQSTTDADERKSLGDDLQRVITEHFEIRQQIREKELQDLQAQIKRLQELHDRRKQEKDRIIGDRLRQLLRDAEGLGWGASESRSRATAF